ncbi:GTP cyclohydrolase I FolE [Bdellovibrio sp. qaytius]|nr:GTP cyclohydrolase I FolE [Bdellovibrio sp. qaytius]
MSMSAPKKTSKKSVKKASKPKVNGTVKGKNSQAHKVLANVLASPTIETHLSNEEKIEEIKFHFSQIMNVLGLDLNDDSLRDTPKRMAKMYVNEVFGGLHAENFPAMTVIENKMQYDQMVCVQNIEVMSMCEHHFQPIDGFATVAYIPKNKVIGLSKINRIVEFFSRRPQVQERLTKQIADCLSYVLETEDIAVHINARHYCVIARGIQDSHSSTTTTDLRGEFKVSGDTRSEFLKQCRNQI